MHLLITRPFAIRLGFIAALIWGLASCGGSDNVVQTYSTVPNVVGQTQAAAALDVKFTGLVVGTVTTTSSSTVEAGIVISQDPAYGVNAALSSAVNLVISSGPATNTFAYVPDAGAGTLSAYTLDPASGALTALAGSPISVPGSTKLYEAKIDPTGQFLYVTDDGSPGQLFAFSIDQGTGALTAVTGSPFAVGNGARSLVFDASGAFLYVANNVDGTISAFSVDTSSGALTVMANSPYTITGTSPQPNQIARVGNFLYVADGGSASIQVFSITPDSGALTQGVPGSPFAASAAPLSLAVDPAGTVLYTANSGQTVSGFTIDAATGELTAIPGTSQIPAANYVSIDPQGRFLFVTEANGVAVYPISATGALTAPAAGSPFVAGSTPYSVGFDLTGEYAYVGNDASANVSEFAINATTGVLTPVAGSPVAAGANPDFVVTN